MRRMSDGPVGRMLCGLPGVHDALPQLVALAAVAQIDLVADFAGPPGPRHDHRNPVQVGLEEPVVPELRHRVAEERLHDVLRLRALDLEGRDVGLGDLDAHAGPERHAARPQQDVAVREGEPEVVLAEAQEDGVVDDAAVLGGDDHVLPLAHGALARVARREAGSVKAAASGPVISTWRSTLTSHSVTWLIRCQYSFSRSSKRDREEHVVVDGVGLGAVPLRGVEERASAQACAALDEVHVEWHIGVSSVE